jgi:hypothetical protein
LSGLFEITTEVTETVPLDQQNRGEVLFKVANLSGRPLYVRARCQPEEADTQDWFSFTTPAERHLTIADIAFYTVKIAAPPLAVLGRYQFQLVVEERDKAEQNFSTGPGVTFEVTKPPAPPRPPLRLPDLSAIPKWFANLPRRTKLIAGGVALAVIVLAIIIGVILAITRPARPDLVIESLDAQHLETEDGNVYLFTVNVANRGNKNSGDFVLGFESRPQDMVDMGYTEVPSIEPGASRAIEMVGYLPFSGEFDSIVITFVADINLQTDEAEDSRENNIQSVNISLPRGFFPTPTPFFRPTPTPFFEPTPTARIFPDLAIVGLNIESAPIRFPPFGTLYRADVTVANVGRTDTFGFAPIEITLRLASSGSVIARAVIEGLKPGESATVRMEWETDINQIGPQDYVFTVDPNNAIPEMDESNNTLRTAA